jgi:hypothetical protein
MTGLKPFDLFLTNYCSIPGKILDIGGAGSIVRVTVESMGHQYDSLNLGWGTYDVTEDPYHWWMIPDNTYDYVISLTAFEHIEFPWLTFLEMVRVTKNNGIIYIIAPSTGGLHPNVLDCWRYFPDGMRALAKWGKVSVIDVILDQKEAWNYCEGIFKKERQI